MPRRVHCGAPEEMSVVTQSPISKGRCARSTTVPVFQPCVVDNGNIPVVRVVKNVVDMLTIAVLHCVVETPVHNPTMGAVPKNMKMLVVHFWAHKQIPFVFGVVRR